MADRELIAIWKQFKLVHEVLYRNGTSIEALQRALDESGLQQQRLYHEAQASQDYAAKHAELSRLIDDTIRKLGGEP
ncbi:MAG TPA: hypothetical protein VMW54_02410 [Terriglobia bacterium]|nr:hypothetical protein [Terriglobia bacterium]